MSNAQTPRSITLKARAKINLSLDVTGRLPNGYHTLETVFQSISLKDDVYIKRTPAPGVILKTNLDYLPSDSRNLVCEVAEFMLARYKLPGGLYIELKKRIPVGAGLGGGSADCATAAFGISQLFSMGLKKSELERMLANFSADAPFCMRRGSALGTNLGDELTSLPDAPSFTLVLGKPRVNISTGYVYKLLDMDNLGPRPDTQGMLEGIRRGNRELMCKSMGNVLESVTMARHPRVRELKERILELGAMGALMSGSGSAVYGLFAVDEEAYAAADRLRRSFAGSEVYVARFYSSKKPILNRD